MVSIYEKIERTVMKMRNMRGEVNMLEIVLLNSDFEEIESTLVQMSIQEAVEMIGKASEITAETEHWRCSYEKTGWIAIDFKEGRIEVQLNTE